jgi:hypothetical protein
MVLETFVAINLAGNILQFADFALRLISQSMELYKSASKSSTENLQLQDVTEGFRDLSWSLKVRFLPISEADEGVATLARACKVEADKLLTILERLKVKQGYHK